MSNNHRRSILQGAALVALAFATAACSISDQTTVEIDPFTVKQGTYYVEQTVELPDDVQNQAVTFDAARVNYFVESSGDISFGGGTVTISFYVSDREEADNEGHSGPQGDEEQVFTVELESSEDLGSGSTSSFALVDILNSGQESFVVALESESSNLFSFDGELILDLEFVLDYTVSFP
ncbi:MAG: hypothetical protein EA383_01925 [Spirochaetaceae bacterium]|nr:MAG: hypothetical protein EA383_01925 [Spirochaetaceae bacterium]